MPIRFEKVPGERPLVRMIITNPAQEITIELDEVQLYNLERQCKTKRQEIFRGC